MLCLKQLVFKSDEPRGLHSHTHWTGILQVLSSSWYDPEAGTLPRLYKVLKSLSDKYKRNRVFSTKLVMSFSPSSPLHTHTTY